MLIPAGFILTAAHCISDVNDSNQPLRCNYGLLNDPIIIEIQFKSDARFKVMPVFADAISDVAVLGPLDHPDLFSEAHAFIMYCKELAPAKLRKRGMHDNKIYRTFINTHDRGWVEAKVTAGGGNTLGFVADGVIENGTSGGPIIDSRGKILGVLSESGVTDGTGSFSFASRCLPVWLSELVL